MTRGRILSRAEIADKWQAKREARRHHRRLRFRYGNGADTVRRFQQALGRMDMDNLVKQLVRHNEAMMEMLQTNRKRLYEAMHDTPEGPVRDEFERQLAGIDKLIADATLAPTKASDDNEDSPALGSPKHRGKMRVEVSINIGMMRRLPEIELSVEATSATDGDWSNALTAARLLSEAAHQLAEDATVAANADKVEEDAAGED